MEEFKVNSQERSKNHSVNNQKFLSNSKPTPRKRLFIGQIL